MDLSVVEMYRDPVDQAGRGDLAVGQEPGDMDGRRGRRRDYCLVAMIANKGNSSSAVVAAVFAIWVILAIAALGAAFVRRSRSREQG
jgi:hypothetical protein